jgi:antitoxin component YwqK of YwqJK toxin-antitoxin module
VAGAPPLSRRRGTLLLLAAAALLAAPAAVGAQAVVAAGGCRDGVPNGAYELRSADGTLRVTGAFARGRRTGTFLFWSTAGVRVALVPYDDDVRAGTVTVWYPAADARSAPRRRLEAAYAAGALHGPKRSWYANGNPRTELEYERGRLAVAAAWAEAGAPLPAAEAAAIAAADEAADEAQLAPLEQAVAEHRPPCAPNGR